MTWGVAGGYVSGGPGGTGVGPRVPPPPLSLRAVLVGHCAVGGLLAVLAGGHALVDAVQPASLLEVADLPGGGEALDGCRGHTTTGGSDRGHRGATCSDSLY